MAVKNQLTSSLGKYATDVMAILILISACVAYGTGFFDGHINTVIDKNTNLNVRIEKCVGAALENHITQQREDNKEMRLMMIELLNRTARIEGSLNK